MFSLYYVYFISLVVCHFGFEGGIVFLIASLLTFFLFERTISFFLLK